MSGLLSSSALQIIIVQIISPEDRSDILWGMMEKIKKSFIVSNLHCEFPIKHYKSFACNVQAHIGGQFPV